MTFTANAKKVAAAFAAAACCALLAVSLTGCGQQQQESKSEDVQLQIFAANSLSKAMEEAQEAYIADGHDNVSFADTQYKSSGELNELLGAGSYADLLISASSSAMDTAVQEGYVNEETRVDMFTNDLVIVAAEDSDIKDVTLDDIAEGKYSICVGDDSVPAGNYAAQSLSTVGVYTPATEEKGKTGAEISGKGGEYSDDLKVVTDTSVGNVCQHAQSGDVDVAFVYTSDVYRFGGVKVVGTVAADTHKAIKYPGAVTANSENAEATQEFLTWCLESEKAQEIWQKWGFEMA